MTLKYIYRRSEWQHWNRSNIAPIAIRSILLHFELYGRGFISHGVAKEKSEKNFIASLSSLSDQ